MGHLDYLGKVIKSWRRYAWQCEEWTETQVEEAFDPRCDAVVKADIPMYSTPHGLLMVPPPPPPAGEEAESSDPVKEKRRFLRRLVTSLTTLRKNLDKKSNEEVADDDSLLVTLENAVSAKKGYMHHRDRCPW